MVGSFSIAVTTLTTWSKNQVRVTAASQIAIKDFKLMVIQAKMLVTNWVYLQMNSEDKKELRDLQDYHYPALRDKIEKLMPTWEKNERRLTMDSVFSRFDSLLMIQKESIMANLQSFEDYEDPLTKLLAEDAIESQVIKRTTVIIGMLDRITGMQEQAIKKSDTDIVDSINALKTYTHYSWSRYYRARSLECHLPDAIHYPTG